MRTSEISRKTKETDVYVKLSLDKKTATSNGNSSKMSENSGKISIKIGEKSNEISEKCNEISGNSCEKTENDREKTGIASEVSGINSEVSGINSEVTGIEISTGIGFFDHMLEAFAFHAGLRLELSVKGDLHVDMHHVVEDTAIVLGKALAQALDKGGPVARYACSFVPMDDALARTVIDISGRPYLSYSDSGLSQKNMPGFDASLIPEFLRAFAFNSGMTLHARVEYGDNAHHMAEALFKSLGRALKQAVYPADGVLSTKGILD